MYLVVQRNLHDKDGYELWLHYAPVDDTALFAAYRAALAQIVFGAPSPTMIVARDELTRGLRSLLAITPRISDQVVQSGTLVAGTPQSSSIIASLDLQETLILVDSAWNAFGNQEFFLYLSNNGCAAYGGAFEAAGIEPVEPIVHGKLTVRTWKSLVPEGERCTQLAGQATYFSFDGHEYQPVREIACLCQNTEGECRNPG